MRKYLSVLLSLILLLTFAVPVLAATYEFIFPTTVTDTSGIGRSYYPVALGFSGDSLVNSGKINANGLDTSMQISGGEIKYMISDGEVMAVAFVTPPAPCRTLRFIKLTVG